jgi:hypothetical protein
MRVRDSLNSALLITALSRFPHPCISINIFGHRVDRNRIATARVAKLKGIFSATLTFMSLPGNGREKPQEEACQIHK